MFWSQGISVNQAWNGFALYTERDQSCGQTKRRWWYEDMTVYKRAHVGRGQCSRKDKVVVSPGEAMQNAAINHHLPWVLLIATGALLSLRNIML
jgi:hypothetical protein